METFKAIIFYIFIFPVVAIIYCILVLIWQKFINEKG